MSIVIETTLGDVTVDLYINDRPRACLNFLKLCKIKYYNHNLFHTISRGFIAQTGDPSGGRSGGKSIYGVLDGHQKRYYEGENEPRIKHTKMGLISFVGNEDRMIGSQFFLTLGEDLTYLDEKHCVFGEIVEGFDVLEIINEVICDNDDRPYQDVRITHTVILDDPFPNPKRLVVPSRSPSPSIERLKGGRIAPDEEIDELEGKTTEEVTEMQAEREAKARATILEMVGDLPDAEMAPPENVLFVCKLNPVTNDDDLEIIFSRFGKVKSCEVIRDKKTGDSLQYAFVEFEDKAACENAYFKMDNVLIDDRRIHVDFSQSVSKVKWRGKGRGVTHYDDKGRKSKYVDNNIGKGNYKHKRNEHNENRPREQTESKSNRKYHDESKYKRETSHQKSSSNYDRTYYKDSRNRSEFSKNERRKSVSLSPERNNSERNQCRSNIREKYTGSKTHRDKSASPRRAEGFSRRRERSQNRYSRERVKEMDATKSRKKSSSPAYRKDRHVEINNSKRRNRSQSPRHTKTKYGDYEKTEKYRKNISLPSSSRKTSTERKSHNKRSDSSASESDNRSRYRKTEKRNKKIASPSREISPVQKRTKYSPEKKSKRSNEDNKKGHQKSKQTNKKKKYSSSSEESSSDNDEKYTKEESSRSKSSGDEYVKSKSKKKKSGKKNVHSDSCSDSNDYKKTTKKKKKYDSSD